MANRFKYTFLKAGSYERKDGQVINASVGAVVYGPGQMFKSRKNINAVVRGELPDPEPETEPETES